MPWPKEHNEYLAERERIYDDGFEAGYRLRQQEIEEGLEPNLRLAQLDDMDQA